MVMRAGGTSLHSGGLAKATGVSPDTIRHYEKIGILPPSLRTASGYRLYPESAVERVRVVQRALRIGFTLAELADVLKARDGDGVPCQRVHKLAREKLNKVSREIAALKKTEKYLKQVVSDWAHRMQSTPPGERSHLLESLTIPRKSGHGRIEFPRRKL
jgi:DNA-binding transcriptional MerR regulator